MDRRADHPSVKNIDPPATVRVLVDLSPRFVGDLHRVGFLGAAELHDKSAISRAVVKAAREAVRAAMPPDASERQLQGPARAAAQAALVNGR